MIWETVGSSHPPRRREPMYRQITQEERYEIAAMRRRRFSMRAIARELGRSPSTISREVRRNLKPDGGYRAAVAGVAGGAGACAGAMAVVPVAAVVFVVFV